MKEDPEAQTNSLLDMLRKVPMVTVDGEDNIKVNGSSGFKVYVNGKPSQMMSSNPSLILKTIRLLPSSALKSSPTRARNTMQKAPLASSIS